MRRVGNLFAELTSFSHLLDAYQQARRGCGDTPGSRRFTFYLEPEILALQRELQSGSYQPCGYRRFTIHDPKTRIISVAPFRDRVVHHAVVGVLEKIFEPRFIFDSYATRKNKGTHAAVRRAQHFLRRRKWYLQIDIQKYFDNIDHTILLSRVARKIKDDKLRALLNKIIAGCGVSDKGLPIGNLTSQFLANVYLDYFDHKVKEGWQLHEYLRYMDDMVFFADDSTSLHKYLAKIEKFLGNALQLKIKPSSVKLNRSGHGLSFLGRRIFPGLIRIRPENRRRSQHRLQSAIAACQAGNISEEHLGAVVMAIDSHLHVLG